MTAPCSLCLPGRTCAAIARQLDSPSTAQKGRLPVGIVTQQSTCSRTQHNNSAFVAHGAKGLGRSCVPCERAPILDQPFVLHSAAYMRTQPAACLIMQAGCRAEPDAALAR